MTNKRVRGRWAPSPEQISLAIDCATAKMPIDKAAELIGVRPRTLWLFAKRVGGSTAASALARYPGAALTLGRPSPRGRPAMGGMHEEADHRPAGS